MRQPNTSTNFEIVFRGTYIHVRLAENFEITPHGMEKLWKATADACQEFSCSKVLSEGKIHSRRLQAWDVYNSGTRASEIPSLRHACLFYNYKPDDITEFFKTVAANRGSYIEFFTDKAEALAWLGVSESE